MNIRNLVKIEMKMEDVVAHSKSATYKSIDDLAVKFKNACIEGYCDILREDGNEYMIEIMDMEELYIWISEQIDCVVEYRDEIAELRIEELANDALSMIADECHSGFVGIESEDVEKEIYEILKKKFA